MEGAGNLDLQRKKATREEERRRSSNYSFSLLIELIEMESHLQTTRGVSGDYGELTGRRPCLKSVMAGCDYCKDCPPHGKVSR